MKIYTVGQIAKICKVAPRTVSKWFDSGRLKGYRIPGSQDRRIPHDYLVKFLKEHNMPLGELEPAPDSLETRYEQLQAELTQVKAINTQLTRTVRMIAYLHRDSLEDWRNTVISMASDALKQTQLEQGLTDGKV